MNYNTFYENLFAAKTTAIGKQHFSKSDKLIYLHHFLHHFYQ
ncbi:MAG: hypothetical protein ACRC62_37530 [Microcoleus sp.]